MFVHYRNEVFIVMSLDQMCQFMNNQILKTLPWLLSEFEIQPDAASISAATAPLGFHQKNSDTPDSSFEHLFIVKTKTTLEHPYHHLGPRLD
jgi:hypothetical protein